MPDAMRDEFAAPVCTVCGKQATGQDIDGSWWPPCEHPKMFGLNILRYADQQPAPAPDAPAARQRFPDAFAFRSMCCEGEKCLRCGAPADGKIEEVIFDDDPVQMRHPFTAYLCKAHLRETLIAAFGKER